MLHKQEASLKKNTLQELKSLLFPFLLLLFSFKAMPKFDIFRLVIFSNSFIIMALIFRFKILKHISLLYVNFLLIVVNIVMSYFYWEKYVYPISSASVLIDYIFVLYIGIIVEIILTIKVHFFRNNQFATIIAMAPALILFAISIYIGQSNLYIFPAIIFALIIFLIFSFKEQKTEKH